MVYQIYSALSSCVQRETSGLKDLVLEQAAGGRSYMILQNKVSEDMANGFMQCSEHVAVAVLWTVDHCTRPAQDTAGKFSPIKGEGARG